MKCYQRVSPMISPVRFINILRKIDKVIIQYKPNNDE